MRTLVLVAGLVAIVAIAGASVMLGGMADGVDTRLTVTGMPPGEERTGGVPVAYWIPNVGLVDRVTLTVSYEDKEGSPVDDCTIRVMVTGGSVIYLDVSLEESPGTVTVIDTFLPYTSALTTYHIRIMASAPGQDAATWESDILYGPR